MSIRKKRVPFLKKLQIYQDQLSPDVLRYLDKMTII